MSQQVLDGKRKYITLMISRYYIIKRSESGRAKVHFLLLTNIISSTVYDVKKQKDQLVSFMASDESVKGPVQATHIETM
jgi:hypothetical protein